MSDFNQTKYINDYMKKNYDTFKVQVPKGTKDPLKDYYQAMDYKSLNDYVVSLIKSDLEQAMNSVNEQAKIHADIESQNIRK